MGNKGLLTVIAVVLIGIFTVLVINFNESQKSPGEKIADGVSETFHELGDEIDNSTKN